MTARPEAHEIWMGPLPTIADGGLSKPRIGIAGISIESSTFSPHVSGDEAFTVRTGRHCAGTTRSWTTDANSPAPRSGCR